MAYDAVTDRGRVRGAELIAALSLATDLAMCVPFEYGLQSTLVAMRLCDRLEVDQETAAQTYFLCLLFYVGCTAPADVGPEVFGSDESFATYAIPARFGSRSEMARGMLRAVAPPGGSWPLRAWQTARGLPRLALGLPSVVAASCDVARMLTDRLGLSSAVSQLFAYEGERWDGKGLPGGVEGDAIPLPVRIVHVARDAALQRLLSDDELVAQVIGQRAGAAFDPTIAGLVAENPDIVDMGSDPSHWERVLASEPKPWLTLEGEAIDPALAAMGHFSDIAVPHLVGHSSGVAALASAGGTVMGLDRQEQVTVHRAALVHDLGRVAVPARIWERTDALTADDWEQIRLHAYQSERVLARSSFLARLAAIAGRHHERLDGSGYHRGAPAASLDPTARLLAAADAYHAMTEPRPHRQPLAAGAAADTLSAEARAGRLDPDVVSAVLEAAGHRRPPIERPAGLTERELEVVRLLARGLQTKQVARVLGISVKTADYHVQNSYRKMGVSTRAGATLFAMQNGLATLGELPIENLS
jgi:HD-GYP domain-containing protein (c-di-GMP phosphodiesterase class II)